MAPKVCSKTYENLNLEVTLKTFFMIFVGENLYAKVAQNIFGGVWRSSSKNPSHPRNFACSYNCAMPNHISESVEEAIALIG